MTNNLEQLNPYGSSSGNSSQSSRSDKQLSELRRGTWLLEMERALLDANDIHGAPEPVKHIGHAPQNVTIGEQVAPATRKTPVRHDNSTVAANLAGASPQPRDGHATPSAQPNRVGVEASAKASAVRGVAPTLAAEAKSAISTAIAPTSQAQAQLASPGQPSRLPESGKALGASLALIKATVEYGLQPPPTAMHAGASDFAARHPDPTRVPLSALERDTGPGAMRLNPLAALRSVLPSGELGFGLTDKAPNSEPEHEAEMLDLHARAKEQAEAQEQFVRRQLHLYQGADGVQAWIRDADLTQTKVQMIAHSLGNELNGAGLKLKALTVNGKKLNNLTPDEHDDTGGQSLTGASPELFDAVPRR